MSAAHLAREAAEAAEVRRWQTHPDVVALKVERTRTLVDRLIWGGIILGLLFTMVNVQQFAARTDQVGPGDLGWWSAWVLDPTVSLILLGILIAERHVAPGQIKLGRVPLIAKCALLAAIYVMNTWESWTAGSAAGVILHSVPPLVVFLGAEAVTDCHDKLTAYVQWAHDAAARRITEQDEIAQQKAQQRAVELATEASHELKLSRQAALEAARHEAELESLRRASQSSVEAPVDAQPAPVVMPLSRPRKTRGRSTAAERKAWIEQQIRAGRDVSGSDVKAQFPDASNMARDVAAVRSRLAQEQADRRSSVHMVKGNR